MQPTQTWAGGREATAALRRLTPGAPNEMYT